MGRECSFAILRAPLLWLTAFVVKYGGAIRVPCLKKVINVTNIPTVPSGPVRITRLISGGNDQIALNVRYTLENQL